MPAEKTFTQDGRMIAVTSPLEKDVLLLSGFHIEEEMSRPFLGRLDVLSTTHDVDPKKLIGKGAGVKVTLETGKSRFFHGIVRSFEAGGLEDRGLRRYRLEIVPWTWLLTLKTDCRIFQKLTVVEIIEKIFGEFSFSDFEKSALKKTYAKREYCVQYRESSFDFVSRLMEEEGIFYFYKYEEGRHVMVLGEGTTAYQTIRENEVKFSDGTLDEHHVAAWSHRHQIRSGAVAHKDFNFETSTVVLLSKTTTVVDLPGTTKYEQYDYPGGFQKGPDGDALAKQQMEVEEVGYSVVSGGGTCVSFTVAGKFKLKKFDPDDTQEEKGFVITSIVHEAKDDSYATGGVTGEYWNQFACIPDNVPFRAARVTSRPIVHGTQTATVVGPSGEEIYTDKYGRVKVQFHWDREGKKDENSSCWVRVAQIWAGNKWGAHFHPRIGQEVVVDFLEGDPDRPLIVGRVYNDAQMPPYELPKFQSQSGVKSRSTKSGTEENFNELRFEDKKDAEEIYFHAEKDFKRVVENDDVLEVGLVKKDKGDQTITVHNDRTITVKEGKQTCTVEKGDDLLQVKTGKHTILVDTGDELLQVKTGKRTVLVDTADDIHTVKMGNRTAEVSMGNDSLTVKMGNQTTKVSLGKIETEAMQSIELKCGQSSIKIDQMGVTIKGMMIKVEGQVQTSIKGLMTDVKGDAMLTVKGGITMIN